MAEDYREIVRRRVLDETTFVQMTLKGKQPGAGDLPWRKVTVRPVLIKNRRHLQFSHFTGKQDFTKNYSGAEAVAHLDEILALPFSSIVVRSTDEDLQVQINRPGKAILRRERPAEARAPELAHDAAKDLPIPADKPDPFLQATGIQTADGRIKADMRGKFAQINEFLKLLEHTGALETFDHTPLHILDCGCGSSYLSFATYHYVNDLKGIPARLVGVDTNGRLIDKSNAASADLGLTDVCFIRSPIADYQPDVPPDIVLALHACDTATDDALALGICHNAGLILSVPCCHHHLHEQLDSRAPFEPVMRHGILKKRFADLLTDSFRALILRIMGYKTDVVEFVSSEHTDRNLMIRAVKRVEAGDPAFVREYRDLKAFWNVTPYLETLLGERFTVLTET
ncbi:MAG: SAM-dependent methyltransferase [Chloroflexi bacterium]|nr:SAM-dependent methyltransferase [Chloroflexota bacterium]